MFRWQVKGLPDSERRGRREDCLWDKFEVISMSTVFATKRGQEVDIQYVNAAISGVVEENYEGYFFDHENYSLEEVLQDQECVYQSLQTNGAGGSTASKLGTKQSGDEIQVSPKMGEPSHSRAKSQLEIDEELAMALQELENQLDSTSLSETTGIEAVIDNALLFDTCFPSSAVNREVNSTDASIQAVRQDNIDPDNMTYEELQSLGEAIGSQSKGLSDELISYLPSYKYKTGFFSKKEKHEDCVICYMTYKKKDVLTTLPCQHQYHSKCVTRWLKLNKVIIFSI
ncbi:hypothetical protein GIB67_028326 [Kingdonia uniflora]|uniref:RING-type domain-containing protein n=1 Tax=Kingdonia uniflora TaxID=39325 RepID=A0A7J7MI35_9MAGN|nr:hypothetical protein GIB67_028326 [Kingdonia uniflora]